MTDWTQHLDRTTTIGDLLDGRFDDEDGVDIRINSESFRVPSDAVEPGDFLGEGTHQTQNYGTVFVPISMGVLERLAPLTRTGSRLLIEKNHAEILRQIERRAAEEVDYHDSYKEATNA